MQQKRANAVEALIMAPTNVAAVGPIDGVIISFTCLYLRTNVCKKILTMCEEKKQTKWNRGSGLFKIGGAFKIKIQRKKKK